jgi:y4mF family transcriptional regulator
MKNLGQLIKKRRKELLLTQQELADLAQVSERLVRQLEADKATVRLDKLEDVLAVVGLELAVIDYVPEALR